MPFVLPLVFEADMPTVIIPGPYARPGAMQKTLPGSGSFARDPSSGIAELALAAAAAVLVVGTVVAVRHVAGSGNDRARWGRDRARVWTEAVFGPGTFVEESDGTVRLAVPELTRRELQTDHGDALGRLYAWAIHDRERFVVEMKDGWFRPQPSPSHFWRFER